MSDPLTLHIRHDARFEAGGASVEIREGWPDMKLEHEADALRGGFTAVLTEREARAIAACLTAAANELRVRAESTHSSQGEEKP